MRMPILALALVLSLPLDLRAFAQASDTSAADANQAMAQWTAANSLCRNSQVSALEAIGACQQRDTYSKFLTLAGYCYGPAAKDGPAGWTPCTPAKAVQDAALARSTVGFQRMGGVFVLPGTLNGSAQSYFIVDSGAANVQIPEEVAEQLRRAGTLLDSDFLGERRFVVADGRGLLQRVIRLRSLQIGERKMENVLAAIGEPRSRALLGQSFLGRLNWWKIDNVKNAIELEFTGAN